LQKFSPRPFYWLIAVAVLSFIPSLFLNFIGEEANFSLYAYEMHVQHEYWVPLFYGGAYWRPPLFSWLAIPLADLLSWDHVLIANRMVAAAGTLGSAWVLFIFSKFLLKDRMLALWICLIYLTCDASFYHGWLVYADPIYDFLCLAAVAALWTSVLKRNTLFLLLSLGLLSAAYLTKAINGYFFYFTTLLGLFYLYRDARKFLILRSPLFLLALGILPLWAWLTQTYAGAPQGGQLVLDAVQKFVFPGHGISAVLHYLQLLFNLPIEWVLKLFPISLFFLYSWIQKRYHAWRSFPGAEIVPFIALLFLINLLPFWLSPQTPISVKPFGLNA
jgi:hypothetical protein